MKIIRNKIHFACMMAALLLAACAADEPTPEPKNEGAVILPRLEFKVSEMTMSESSRASAPMNPDEEKYVKTLAIFEFDNEGVHDRGSKTYHFINFVDGTVDGKKNLAPAIKPTEFGVVESTLEGLDFEYRSDGTLCLVANVDETQVDALYNDSSEPEQSSNRLRLDQFQDWALTFRYAERWGEVYDDSKIGHILDMYMFGYYEGEIKPAEAGAIRINLGRLASRLDITVVNDTDTDITQRLGYHLDNVCIKGYFFPMKKSVPPVDSMSIARTLICSGAGLFAPGHTDHEVIPETFPAGKTHTHYFYVAAHSAKGYQDATILHLFCGRQIPMADIKEGKEPNSVEVPLCNVNPYQAGEVLNGYSLSRNTRYHFTIRLRQRATSPASLAPIASTASTLSTVSSRSEQFPAAEPEYTADQAPTAEHENTVSPPPHGSVRRPPRRNYRVPAIRPGTEGIEARWDGVTLESHRPNAVLCNRPPTHHGPAVARLQDPSSP